jgi:hypothetical protein
MFVFALSGVGLIWRGGHGIQRYRTVARPRAGWCGLHALPANTPKEAGMHLAIRLADVVGKMRHTQWWMHRLSSYDGAVAGTSGLSPSQAVPFHGFVFADRIHAFFYQAMDFVRLPLRSYFAHGAHY